MKLIKKIFIGFILLGVQQIVTAQSFSTAEITKWKDQANRVTIIRDNWGIPHVFGKSDADAVFGLLYAQCEDDFKRVEMNYVEKLGRMSEVKGESELYNDLLIRMIIDSSDAKKDFASAPAWLKKLMNAYADGINYYLFTHPQTKPALLKRFEPWYPLLWTDGSIGAIDIADITVTDLKNFYSNDPETAIAKVDKQDYDPLPGGSNGFAIAPSKTVSGNAILYINPHTTYYFRPEVAVQSEEGLHAYGAVTWGQFFVYQGFNEHLGWMHTSSYSDVADSYIEKVKKINGTIQYEYDGKLIPVKEKQISIQYLNNGNLISKSFKTYYTHHGPVMAKKNGSWISVKANNRDIKGLIQSWQRTKANNYEEYKKSQELLANTSNNTVYADDKGNIAYWHGNFMPKRDPKYNWSKPVDGTTKATEWKGLHTVEELIQVKNPGTGWIQNCNSSPFTVSGISSPKKADFPKYMAPNGDNFRGINAVQLFKNNTAFTLDKIIATAYNKHLPAFDVLVPALIKAYNANKSDPSYAAIAEPMQLISNWDHNVSETSIAATLSIEWAQKLWPIILKGMDEDDESDQVDKTIHFANTADAKTLIAPLIIVISELEKKFGTWKQPWGEVNRFQRLTGNITEVFDDSKPSLPAGLAASTWGCLPSFTSKSFNGTNRRYGYNGNSFICAVEFGKKVTAKSLLAGGESGDPSSKHFTDQAEMYTKGQFKEVLFYKEDVLKHVEKKYHPGDSSTTQGLKP
ncbi:MAG: penicillin acylase family protein [Bacteroidota bacterium]